MGAAPWLGLKELQSSIACYFHDLSHFRSLIDPEDQFHGLASFAAVDGGSTAGFDGANEISELPRVSNMRDRRWVAGTAGSPGFYGEPPANGSVFLGLWRQLPAQYVVLLDHHGSPVAVNC